jgi:hypothetical protein
MALGVTYQRTHARKPCGDHDASSLCKLASQNTLESRSKQQQKPASTWGSSKDRVESEGGKGRRLKPKGEVSIKRKLGFSSARILV